MKSKNSKLRTFEVTVPLKLFKIIHCQAQHKFRTVSEEVCIILTDTLLSPTTKRTNNPLQLFDELLEHSEKREASQNKKQQTQNRKKKASSKIGDIISINKEF